MKTLFICFFLLLNALAFAQTPPVYPGHDFTINSGDNGGYLFMTYQPVNPLDPALPAILLYDTDTGHLLFYRSLSPDASGFQPGAADFKLLPNGKMAYFRTAPSPGGNAFNFGKYYLMDGSFTDVDSVGCDGFGTDGHELQVTPSGNYLLLCTEDSTMDLSGMTINGEAGFANSTVRGQGIQEVSPAGNAVNYWSPFAENLVSDMYDEQWAITYTENNPILDWSHCNAIEQDGSGKMLLSSRHFNQILKIDMAGDSVMWRFGGKRDDYGLTENTFTGQHDIRRLPNGNVTFYNNAQFATVQSGRPMEWSLNESTKSASLVDEYVYDADMISLAMGSHRKLPNGNTLLSYGVNVQTSQSPFAVPRVLAVDPSDQVELEFYFDDPLAFTYRAQHAPSLPFALNRPGITVSNGPFGRKILDAGIHAGYRWNTGQTTRRITVQPGSTAEDYFCYVPKGEGYISSEVVTLGGSSKRGAANVDALSEGLFVDVYPNPSDGRLKLHIEGMVRRLNYQILDLSGQVLAAGELLDGVEHSLDLRQLPAGIYLLDLSDPSSSERLRKKVVLR